MSPKKEPKDDTKKAPRKKYVKKNITLSNISELTSSKLKEVKEEIKAVIQPEEVKKEVKEEVKEEIKEVVQHEDIKEEIKEVVPPEEVKEVVKKVEIKEIIKKKERVKKNTNNLNDVVQGEEDKTVVQGEEVKAVVQGEEDKTVVQGEEVKTVVQGEEVKTVVQGEEVKTVVQGEEVKTVVQGEEIIGVVQGEENIYETNFSENKKISYGILNEEFNKSKNQIEEVLEMAYENDQNIDLIINELSDNDKYILTENELNNILVHDQELNKIVSNNYTFTDLFNTFQQFKEAVILIQISDNKIKFIERKGYESRNQSVIDLLYKTSQYKKLSDCQFIIFTDDIITNEKIMKIPYLLTFCKNHKYNTTLFPNFNFNHWYEANIDNYENMYNYFTTSTVNWSNKNDLIFWSGANTNSIREKLYNETKDNNNYFINIVNKNKDNYISIEDTIKYKYLLNLNGKSYAGRLNYLFLTGSCVIILTNENKDKYYEEFFYKYFKPNVDYLEIMYNDNETIQKIVEKIDISIKINNCEEIAKRCFEKAKKLFQIENIYEYIYNLCTNFSKQSVLTPNTLNQCICYTPQMKNTNSIPLNYYFKNRLTCNNNEISFIFKGNDFEIKLKNIVNFILIKIINNNTAVYYNDQVILEKFTPYLLNENKNQKYKISVINNELLLIIENKFTLIRLNIPSENFEIIENEIKTENGGLWII